MFAVFLWSNVISVIKHDQWIHISGRFLKHSVQHIQDEVAAKRFISWQYPSVRYQSSRASFCQYSRLELVSEGSVFNVWILHWLTRWGIVFLGVASLISRICRASCCLFSWIADWVISELTIKRHWCGLSSTEHSFTRTPLCRSILVPFVKSDLLQISEDNLYKQRTDTVSRFAECVKIEKNVSISLGWIR